MFEKCGFKHDAIIMILGISTGVHQLNSELFGDFPAESVGSQISLKKLLNSSLINSGSILSGDLT
jgi:hypothetical protein